MAQFVMMKEERHRTVRREVQREFHWDQEHYPITFHDDDDDDEKPYNKYNNNNNNNYVEQCYWNPCHITYSNQMKPRVETRVIAPPKVINTVHHQYHQQRPTHMGRSRIIQQQLPNHQLITMKNNPALSSAPAPAPKIMTCDEVAQLYGGVVFNTVW
uniref:Uncharacterized protein n=1 Tax=Cannabis sativa TaxID=3483 RepID=A0A803R7J6_CANSA